MPVHTQAAIPDATIAPQNRLTRMHVSVRSGTKLSRPCGTRTTRFSVGRDGPSSLAGPCLHGSRRAHENGIGYGKPESIKLLRYIRHNNSNGSLCLPGNFI